MITTLRNSQCQYFVCYSDKEKFDLRTDKNYMHYDNVDIHIQRNAIVYAINNKTFYAPAIQLIEEKLKVKYYYDFRRIGNKNKTGYKTTTNNMQ